MKPITLGEGLEVGAGDRIRTGDIDLGKVALYQLSYSRSKGMNFYFHTTRGRVSNRWEKHFQTRVTQRKTLLQLSKNYSP